MVLEIRCYIGFNQLVMKNIAYSSQWDCWHNQKPFLSKLAFFQSKYYIMSNFSVIIIICKQTLAKSDDEAVIFGII